VTEQLAAFWVELARAQLVEPKVPLALLLLQLTFPVGALLFPVAVSCTVAVQLVAVLTASVLGLHVTVVVVVRVPAAMTLGVLPLGAKTLTRAKSRATRTLVRTTVVVCPS
jgi:hypothetical protein